MLSALAMLLAMQRAPECVLAGQVISAATGQGLNKAQVLVEPIDGERRKAQAVTGSSGQFCISQLAAGVSWIRARRTEYLETAYGARRSGSAGIPVRVSAGQPVSGLEIRMSPYGVVGGTVRDPDGDPLPGVTVSAWRVMYEKGKRTTTSEAHGRTNDVGPYRESPAGPVLRSGSAADHAGCRSASVWHMGRRQGAGVGAISRDDDRARSDCARNRAWDTTERYRFDAPAGARLYR
ncbi:MAG: carboxypeptidase regulatory-like domain-containing protein [Bryobacterales bacterium]|nr:carboxypeptidase regulatory-like domain-containing protein [Bryobacterales bacterium]